MSFRHSVYDADQINLTRIWDLSAERANHLRHLETIYKQRQAIRARTEKDHIKRQKQLQKYQRNKLKDFNSRNKSLQDKINYENALLRNKIIQVYTNNGQMGQTRKSKSVFIRNMEDKISPTKNSEAEEMYKTNLKIGARLHYIKSEVGAICNDKEHYRESKKLLDMIQKKSPKKRAYLKSLVKKKVYSNTLLPQLHQKMIDQVI